MEHTDELESDELAREVNMLFDYLGLETVAVGRE